MSVIFPSGNDPFIFSDTLPLNSTDTLQSSLDQHVFAFNVADFTAAAPAGSNSLFLTFVVFAYPNSANTASAFPKPPIFEILQQGAGFDGAGRALRLTPDGTDSLDLGAGRFVNYSYKSLGGGVFQALFTPNNVPIDSLTWKARFTINDGTTSPQAQTGLTFIADDAGIRAPWIAVPGQLTLSPSGPRPIDFAATLAGTTLAGSAMPSTGAPLQGGTTFSGTLPIGNYGTGPLTLTAIASTGGPGHLSAQLAAMPLVIPPGSVNLTAVQASYAAPANGETGDPAATTRFVLASDDPLATPGGAAAHFATIALFASSVPAGSAKPPSTNLLSGGSGVIFDVRSNGDLAWYTYQGNGETIQWHSNSSNLIGNGWQGNLQVFGGADGVIYVVRSNGDLAWYKYQGNGQSDRSGATGWHPNSGHLIGHGWQGNLQVFGGADGVIYVIRTNGDLAWYKYQGNGQSDRSGATGWHPNSGHLIGNGWQGNLQVFGGADQVIYVVRTNGDLAWYQYQGEGRSDRSGAQGWNPNSGHVIGNGWS